MDAPSRRAVTVTILALILDLLAFTCILPLFPTLLDFYGSSNEPDPLFGTIDDLLRRFQTLVGVPDLRQYKNVLFGGLLGSLFSILQFLASPAFGALSDSIGRKPVIIGATLGSLLSYILWLRAGTFTGFVAARVVGGLSKGNVGVATAVLSDVYSKETIGKGMALVGIAYSIGFLIGPMVGAYFATIQRSNNIAPDNGSLSTWPPLFAIVLTLVQLLLLVAALPETLKRKDGAEKKKTSTGSTFLDLVSPLSIFRFARVRKSSTTDISKMRRLGAVLFLFLFLYSGLEFTLAFLTHLRFNYTSMQQSRIYVFTGILMLLLQGSVVRRAAPRKLAILGLCAVIPAFLIVAVAYDQTRLYVGLTLYGIASATVVTSLSSLVSSAAHPDERGVVAGTLRSIGALARALGPLAAATVFWLAGSTACYTIGGILLVLPLFLLKRIDILEDVQIKRD